MEMIKIVLDANIYDKLRDDRDARTRVANGVASGGIQIVATPVLAEEIIDSPFGGFPDYFPVSIVPETVAVLGHARLGMASLGTGEIYTAHRGASAKINVAYTERADRTRIINAREASAQEQKNYESNTPRNR